jgi:hypothetical protein
MERKKASDFPGVLKLFDGYVHGWIDRRVSGCARNSP